MTKPSITTRNGDHGYTSLFSGEQIEKSDPRADAYGDLDELVSILGVAYAHASDSDLRTRIEQIQQELFVVGAELATSLSHVDKLEHRISEKQVVALDEQCRKTEAGIQMPNGFILPGGSVVGAFLDHARTVARRVERKVVALHRNGFVKNELLLVWVNRLSDYLWLLAREDEGDALRKKDLSS